jgi:adenylate cyclase
MPSWNQTYLGKLEERFDAIVEGLDSRIDAITQGRAAPGLEDMAIGSGRHVYASVLFFDICGFTNRTSRDDLDSLGETLYMLDCVVPMVMHVIFDHGGYVEKNTGDGVMAIVGVGEQPERAATEAIKIATVSLYALENIVNPHLVSVGIDPVDVSFGIDFGQLLLARIGTHRGGSKQDRSHITAVGPTANIAFQLQELAGSNEIIAGDLVVHYAEQTLDLFEPLIVPDWTWSIGPDAQPYYVWQYTGRKRTPVDLARLLTP